MDLIPIPYFGMIMSLFVLPSLIFGFIAFLKWNRAEVERLRFRKEILELEARLADARLVRPLERRSLEPGLEDRPPWKARLPTRSLPIIAANRPEIAAPRSQAEESDSLTCEFLEHPRNERLGNVVD